MHCFRNLHFNYGECTSPHPQEFYKEILLYTIDTRTQDSNPQPQPTQPRVYYSQALTHKRLTSDSLHSFGYLACSNHTALLLPSSLRV